MFISSCCQIKRKGNLTVYCVWCVQSDDSGSGQQSQVSQIYQVGCLSAGEQWINSNIIPVAGVSIGLAVLEVSAL